MTTKKRKNTPVVMSKKELILPRMEFIVLDSATGAGLFVKELGGKNLLEYREKVNQMKIDGEEPTLSQSIELMTDLVLRTTCNPNGTPYFTREEVDLLADTSLIKLEALATFSADFSGMRKEATNNLKNDPNSSSTDS